MRALLLSASVGLAVGLAAVPAGAQTFRLVDPALTVDGRRVGVAGAPLAQDSFGQLALAVPGEGTYRVSDAPFDGSRAVGQFDGDGLYFALDGRSVRLRSAGPILDAGRPSPAHVRFDADAARSARGLARVSVTPGPAARRPAATADAPPRPTAGDARSDADALRSALARARAERAALEAERDRLRAERDARLTAGLPVVRPDAYAQALAQSAALGVQAEVLRAERDQLVASRDRALAERAALAARLDAALARADAAEATGRSTRTADDEAGRLRAEIVARDQALAALRVESDDRRVRLAETDAELARTQRALVATTAERDAARRDLDAARARFEADRRAAAQAPSAVSAEQTALLADRQRQFDTLAAVQAERDALRLQVAALQADRDRLSATVDRLAADLASERLASERARDAAPPPARPAVPRADAPRADAPRADAPRAETAAGPDARRAGTASFPGFDVARLANPDVVRRRLDEVEYPRGAAEGGLSGDVLVLFQTDASGRVIRTAVASPIGGGLDALAESLVRDMQFVPPVVDGQRTGLRSQVLVRFER